MVERHHQLGGYEFEQALGVGDGQGSLARCSPWDHKGSDMSFPNLLAYCVQHFHSIIL